MRITKFAATAVLTTAVLGATASTASGQVPTADQVTSSVSGVTYTTSWKADGSSVSTDLVNGKFQPTADGDTLAVTGTDGAVIGEIPLVYTAAGQKIRLQPQINAAGTSMTVVRPDTAPVQPSNSTTAQNIDFALNDQQIIDIAVGCALGAIIGGIFLILPAIPGCLIGGVVGYLYANGQLP